MSKQNPDNEPLLIAGLRRRIHAYEAAHRNLDAIRQRMRKGEGIVAVCAELQRVLHDIRDADRAAAVPHADTSYDSAPSAEVLRTAVQEHREQLEQLLGVVEELRAAAAADQAALAPRLDEGVRGRRMLAAYAVARE